MIARAASGKRWTVRQADREAGPPAEAARPPERPALYNLIPVTEFPATSSPP